MSVKYYGIYLAYAPGLDLRHEGLGRYLAAFIKGSSERADVQFVMVCPSWSRQGLVELLSSEGINTENFQIISPANKPVVLRVYESYLARRKRKKKPGITQWIKKRYQGVAEVLMSHAEHRLVTTHDLTGILLTLLESFIALGLAMVLSPLIVALLFVAVLRRSRRVFRRLAEPFHELMLRVRGAMGVPKDDAFILRLYKRMEEVESERMLSLIGRMEHIGAWYSPTAFWPAFNKINAPRLMCVPDVVLSDFPVGFSSLGGNRYLQTFEEVRRAIQTGQHFVTYSEAVKWETLVDHYSVRPSEVTVIHHAPSILSQWVTTSGFQDLEATSRHYCSTLLFSALCKSSNKSYAEGFMNAGFKYLFYASQFRPNKNLLSLLRAYEHLLRKKHISHKLILTGNPKSFPLVNAYIEEHGLQNDVLCLHGLTVQELAACYKLADVAVNPSLSEGGCPFTFTEALSVGTPVVMANIAVTQEVLTDPILQSKTFFDPYDWRDVAKRIEWAIDHREELLALQTITYESLLRRTWRDVVNEHITVLDSISAGFVPREIGI